MCRRPAVVCSQLGSDPTTWPTNQLLPTPPLAQEAAAAVQRVLPFAKENDAAACRGILGALIQEPLAIWYHDHAQHVYRIRALAFHASKPAPLTKAQRDRAYPLKAMEREVFERDGGRCRYCQLPVILREDQRAISRVAGPLFAHSRRNLECSGALIVTRASADHVLPVSRGGKTEPDNLVTACWPCQFGKSNYTPEELGIDRPSVIPA